MKESVQGVTYIPDLFAMYAVMKYNTILGYVIFHPHIPDLFAMYAVMKYNTIL